MQDSIVNGTLNTNSEEGKTQFELVESNEKDPFSLEIDATVEKSNDSEKESISASGEAETQEKPQKKVKKITRKEIFEELYVKYSNLKKKVKKKKILEEMKPLLACMSNGERTSVTKSSLSSFVPL